MEGDTPNNLARDIAQLHLAADQDGDAIEPLEKDALCRTASGNRSVKDISTDFRSAASGLNTGQLVKDPYFTLFEAVGALEIMDPKMDSGLLEEGEIPGLDFQVLRVLLPEEVVGLMDQMLCHEDT